VFDGLLVLVDADFAVLGFGQHRGVIGADALAVMQGLNRVVVLLRLRDRLVYTREEKHRLAQGNPPCWVGFRRFGP
jgi:hypothetical protein